MKKFLTILFAFLIVTFASSCKEGVNLEGYLSELRYDVYTFEDEDYKATCYFEEREDPYLNDGFVGSIKKYFVFKIEKCKTSLDNASISILINGVENKKDLEFNPLNGKFSCQIEVSSFEEKETLEVTLLVGGEHLVLPLKKNVFEKQISYKEALEKVSKNSSKEIEKMLNGGKGGIECRVRIISENSRAYYFVSISGKDGNVVAFLVDGATGKILAKK